MKQSILASSNFVGETGFRCIAESIGQSDLFDWVDYNFVVPYMMLFSQEPFHVRGRATTFAFENVECAQLTFDLGLLFAYSTFVHTEHVL